MSHAARQATDGLQTGRSQQAFARLQQTRSHVFERAGQLGDFIRSYDRYLVFEIAFFR